MASGTISLGTSSNGKLEGRITWSSSSNGTAKNSSQVTGTLQARRTNAYTTTGTWTGTLKLGGTSKSYSVYKGITSSWVTLCSFTITQAHSSSGAGTCAISGSIVCPSGTSLAGTTLSKSQTVTLDTIPRQATLTAAPNFNDEGNPTITYSNPAGNSVTTLQACISLTGAADDIAYRNISKTGTSYTFSLTEAERNVLRNATTTSKTRTVKFFVKTVVGGTTFHSTLTKTLTITNCAPTLSPSIEDVGTKSTVLTGDPTGTIIKYFNAVKVSTGAKALKGATIKSQSVSCGSKKINSGSGQLNYVESDSFIFSVTDSRGYTTTKTIKPATFIEYVKPTCNLNISAPSTSGDLTFTLSGVAYNGSFGALPNSVDVLYQYKTNNGDYSDWILCDPIFTGNKYVATVTMSDLDYLNSYTFQAQITDSVSMYNATTPSKTVKTTPVFDWGENDFRVNVDFSVTGSYVALTLPENTNLDEVLNPNTYVLKNTQSSGYLNCPIDFGTAMLKVEPYGVDGQRKQTITSCNKISSRTWERFKYASSWGEWVCTSDFDGTLLWSGGIFMHDTQEIYLSESIAKQKTGIVLVFCRYSGGTVQNYHFTYHFVPKMMVSMHGGCGSVFYMGAVEGDYLAAKYLYISDKEDPSDGLTKGYIKGNEYNDNELTGNNGIKYTNNATVLRYVIGV